MKCQEELKHELVLCKSEDATQLVYGRYGHKAYSVLPCPGGAAAACLHQEHGGKDEGQVKEEGDQI